MQRTLKLSDRLMAVARFIENGALVADIGTDHGYLPVYLAQNGLARSIIASDISEGSLRSARQSAARHGVSEKIAFVAAPGLDGIGETETDTVVIAGLGGETIAGILDGAPWTKRGGVRLILQPQTKTSGLCSYLRENGYRVRDAELARENDRFYVVLLVKGGASDSALEPEVELLARLMFKRDPLIRGYLDSLIERTSRALEGMNKSSAPDVLNMALKQAVYIGLKEEYEKCLL